MMDQAAVACQGIEFAYEQDPRRVLQGVDFEVGKGNYAVIAGPSGAGKSTFCRTFNNLVPQFFRGNFSGKRWIAGQWLEAQSVASLARKVGMVFQDFEQQLFSTSVALDLAFGPENFGVSREEMQIRMSRLLEFFRMTHLAGREPFSLSGGEKQKLAIASVLAYRPEILVLDEPTTDLDPDSRELVLQTLPELRDWVDTLIVVEHETEHFQSADRIFIFNHGRIQHSGNPEQVLTQSALLKENSLAPLDLVSVQKSLGHVPALVSPGKMAESLKPRSLSRIAVHPRTSSRVVVAIQDLTFRYEGQPAPALSGLSLEINEGEFVGIAGHNGSGKSTLVKHLNGLQHPQQGTVAILGKEVRQWQQRELSRTVGLVFQNPDHQIFEATVRQEVEFGPRHFRYDERTMKENVARAIETMDLREQAERDPFQLSKGERQRVAVASVLSVQPEILILDEPTTGLDDQQQKHLMNLLRELNRAGKTVIIVTHAIRLIAEYCDFMLLLDRGRKIAEGHPREVLFAPDLKLPPLLELSRIMKGNALTVDEFVNNLSPSS